MYESFSIIFTLAVLLSLINAKWLKLPSTIGQMLLALGLGLLVIGMRPLFPSTYDFICGIIQNTDFTHILLDILLGFLLFAGALHVDISALKRERWSVLLFATVSVLISTFLIGGGLFLLASGCGVVVPLLHCLLFGALISPTDPIAVLALLKNARVSSSLQLKIEGESMFNDGIGVIVFSGILLFTGMDTMEGNIGAELITLFAEEVLLGLGWGLLVGWLGYRLMRASADSPHLTTLLSLAIVFGGYTGAQLLHTSGPLAMVVAGLYLGQQLRNGTFDGLVKETLEGFWKVLDEGLNGVVFVMIGLSLHLVSFDGAYLLLGVLAIALVLLSRWVSVTVPYALLKHSEGHWSKTTYMLTWGGLRGGISLALAFSLAPGLSREIILFLTYGIVIFSIVVQGLTIPTLVKKLYS